MITIDASAVLAILFREPEAADFLSIILDAGAARMSAVNLWEVIVRAEAVDGSGGRQDVEDLLAKANIGVEPITAAQARLAADAFRRFGRRTPADLNLGDCFAYALAAEQGDGLLFKGDDFPKTDVKPVALP